MIVDRCHVGQDYGSVRRYVVSRLRHGYRTFKALPRAQRRAILREIHRTHRDNRRLYMSVMGGVW
jgi:hypothetical protein